MTRMRPLIVIVTCVCLITVTSCTKAVLIPAWHYEEANIAEGETYRLETKDDKVYITNRLTLTDSTFVIRNLQHGRTWNYVDPPIVVAIEDVRVLERGGMSGKRKADLVLLTVVVVGLVVVAGLYIWAGKIAKTYGGRSN